MKKLIVIVFFVSPLARADMYMDCKLLSSDSGETELAPPDTLNLYSDGKKWSLRADGHDVSGLIVKEKSEEIAAKSYEEVPGGTLEYDYSFYDSRCARGDQVGAAI